jgi:hypothetical protein
MSDLPIRIAYRSYGLLNNERLSTLLAIHQHAAENLAGQNGAPHIPVKG